VLAGSFFRASGQTHPFGILFTAKSVTVKWWLPVFHYSLMVILTSTLGPVEVIYVLGPSIQLPGNETVKFRAKAIHGHSKKSQKVHFPLII
jgi:hypothetical protein